MQVFLGRNYIPFSSPQKGNLEEFEVPNTDMEMTMQKELAQKRAEQTGSEYISGTNVDDDAARVIFTSSDAMNWGSFHSSLLFGDKGGGEGAELT